MVTALLGLLTPQQMLYVDTMSRVVVNESTDLNETSPDDELEYMTLNDTNKFPKQLIRSK